MRADMVHGCLQSVMAVLPEPEGDDDHQEVWPQVPCHVPTSVGDSGKAAVDSRSLARPPVSFQPLYLDTMQALEDLLTSLLQRDMTPQGLQVMVEVCSGVQCPRGRGPLFVFPRPCHRGATGAVRCLLSGNVGGA